MIFIKFFGNMLLFLVYNITHDYVLMVVVLKAIILMIQEIEIQFLGLATNLPVVNDGPCILIYFYM